MANLTYISPFFIVSDVKEPMAFYVNKLGFDVRYIEPENDPFFAIVGRDHISIMLKAIADGIPQSLIIRCINGALGCIYWC